MSVKSIWFAKIISRYVSTRARAKKSTKWEEDISLAAHIVSQTINTSSYNNSKKLIFIFNKYINNLFDCASVSMYLWKKFELVIKIPSWLVHESFI